MLQGADGNPHAVDLEWSRVVRIPSGPTRPVPVENVHLNVAPARNLFVPFEVGLADLEPGWYVIRTSIQVDAGKSQLQDSRAFSIPWPRSEVRRGSVRVGRILKLGSREFSVERLEMTAEAATVVWRPRRTASDHGLGPGDEGRSEREPDVQLSADGKGLGRLPDDVASSGSKSSSAAERRTVCYPVPRSARALSVVLRLPGGEEAALPVPLD